MRYEFRAARIRSPGSGLVELDMVGHVVAFGKGDCAVRGARNGQVDVPAIGFDALFAAPGAGAGFAHAALGLDVTRALQRGALWLLHARHGVRARCGVECIDSLVVAALVVSRAGRSAMPMRVVIFRSACAGTAWLSNSKSESGRKRAVISTSRLIPC